MGFSDIKGDQFRYAGMEIIDTFHNRMTVLAADSFYSCVGRASFIGGRQIDLVSDFILRNLGRFQILQPDVEEQILEFWYEAAREGTGVPQEFMISVLIEIQSYFNAQIMDMRPRVTEYFKNLYPQLDATAFGRGSQVRSADSEESLYDLFDRSYLFPNKANIHETITKLTTDSKFSWVLPWMVISHADRLVIVAMAQSIAAQVAEAKNNPNIRSAAVNTDDQG